MQPSVDTAPTRESSPFAQDGSVSSTLTQPTPKLDLVPESPRHKKLRESVENLLEVSWGRRIKIEKRVDHRVAFRKPMTITPCDENGKEMPSDRFSGFGVDISMTGLGFVSRSLLTARHAVLTCDGLNSTEVHLLFAPRWVRYTKGGWYQIGGRLLKSLDNLDLVTK